MRATPASNIRAGRHRSRHRQATLPLTEMRNPSASRRRGAIAITANLVAGMLVGWIGLVALSPYPCGPHGHCVWLRTGLVPRPGRARQAPPHPLRRRTHVRRPDAERAESGPTRAAASCKGAPDCTDRACEYASAGAHLRTMAPNATRLVEDVALQTNRRHLTFPVGQARGADRCGTCCHSL